MSHENDSGGRVYRIGISGSYGGLNLGDEAILRCIIAQMRASERIEVTVFSRDPSETLSLHDADRAIPVRDFSRDEILPEIERLDLFVLGGGGILFDGEARVFLREAAIAVDRGIPIMTYAIGAGPLNDQESRELTSRVLDKAALITVREKSAKRVLEDAGVSREIIITADPALLLQPEPLPEGLLHQEGIDGKERLIGISVRERGGAAPDLDEASYHQLLANTADYMAERFDADIAFVPLERKQKDLQNAHAVMAQMLKPERATVLRESYTPGQMLSLVDRFTFAVGMRLHFLMFAALRGVPFVALPYASKVTGFLEELGIGTPPIEQVNSGRLIAYIDYFWDNREQLRRKIAERLPELQRRARRTNELLMDLLRSTDRRTSATV